MKHSNYTICFYAVLITSAVQAMSESASPSNIRRDEQGKTSLHRAVEKESIDRIKKWITKGKSLHIKDNYDNTPLHIASQQGSRASVTLLLEAQAPVHSINKDRAAPIHFAAEHRDTTILSLLLKKGTDVDIQTLREEHTPLHIAALMGNTEACKILIKQGAHRTLRNHDTHTCLELALQENHFETAQEIEPDASLLLKCALRLLDPKMIKKLIKQLENPKKNLTFSDGSTVCHHVIVAGKNNNSNLQAGLIGSHTPLSSIKVRQKTQEKMIEILQLFYELDPSILDKKDSSGRTPLHSATERGLALVCHFLLENKAALDTHVEGSSGTWNPLSLAVTYGYDALLEDFIVHCSGKLLQKVYNDALTKAIINESIGCVSLLLKAKETRFPDYQPNVQPYHLHHACKQGILKIVKTLINFGSSASLPTQQPSPQDVQSWIGADQDDRITPLHVAAHHGHTAICDLLLRKKASINEKTKYHLTPLALACRANQEETIHFLVRKKAEIDEYVLEEASPAIFKQLKEVITKRLKKVPADELGLQEYEITLPHLLKKKDEKGMTVLHRTVLKRKAEKSSHILDEVNCLTLQDSTGKTPLHYACIAKNDPDELRFNDLLWTLRVLVESSHCNQSTINLQDNEGRTALHYACEGGDNAHVAVRMLIENGADPSLRNSSGQSPKDLIRKKGYSKLADIVKK